MDMKYSVKGQIISVLLTHLQAAFLFFILWVIAISFTSTGIGGAIYSAFTTFFYFIMMYSAGYSAEKNDNKSYSPLTPKKYKGAVLTSGVLAINVIMVIMYIVVWNVAGDGKTLGNMWAIAANALFIFWFSPFINFLGTQNGVISPIGYAIMFILPLAGCFLGYIAGYKNFDISAKMKFLVYEKKK